MSETYSNGERGFLVLVAALSAIIIYGFDFPAKTWEVWNNGELGSGDFIYPLVTAACLWSGSAAAASALLNRPAIPLEGLRPGNILKP